MPLQTAQFPIIFVLMFFIVPVIILLGIIIGIFYYFWRFRGQTKFLMIGTAILLLYGIGMTALFVGVSSHNQYYLKVTACNQHQLTGLAEDGKSVTLFFPRWFGSGQSSWGDGPTVKTVDQEGSWNSGRPVEICNQILGTKTNFDTNGLKKIEIVKFLRNSPLYFSSPGDLYDLLPDDIEAQTTWNTISSGWFAETQPDFPDSDREVNCANLAKIYNNKTQIDYIFLADIEKIQQRGEDPYDFSFRLHVLPNLTGYKNIEEISYGWGACYSPEHINSFPILISPSWIAFGDGCEGIFDGCITAQDKILNNLQLE